MEYNLGVNRIGIINMMEINLRKCLRGLRALVMSVSREYVGNMHVGLWRNCSPDVALCWEVCVSMLGCTHEHQSKQRHTDILT